MIGRERWRQNLVGYMESEHMSGEWKDCLPDWIHAELHTAAWHCVGLWPFRFLSFTSIFFRWPPRANDLVAMKVQNLSLLMSDTTLLCPIYSKYHGLSSFLLNPESLIKYKASVCFWKSSSRELNILFGYQRYWNWPNLKLWHSARNAFVLTEAVNWKILLCSTFPVFHFLTFGAPDKRPFVEVELTCVGKPAWREWTDWTDKGSLKPRRTFACMAQTYIFAVSRSQTIQTNIIRLNLTCSLKRSHGFTFIYMKAAGSFMLDAWFTFTFNRSPSRIFLPVKEGLLGVIQMKNTFVELIKAMIIGWYAQIRLCLHLEVWNACMDIWAFCQLVCNVKVIF